MNGIKEKMQLFDNLMLEQLQPYGFKKKKKHEFVRKQGDCLQHIWILDTKVKGEEKVHIYISIGFKYEQVDKLVDYLRMQKYDKKYPTADINVNALMNTDTVFGFYIDVDTDMKPIVNDIINVIVKYGFSFWEKCDTLEKFQNSLINKDADVWPSTFGLNKPEWNYLALAIILGNMSMISVKEVCESGIMKRALRWELDNWETAKKRIDSYEAIKGEL